MNLNFEYEPLSEFWYHNIQHIKIIVQCFHVSKIEYLAFVHQGY